MKIILKIIKIAIRTKHVFFIAFFSRYRIKYNQKGKTVV